MAPSIADSPLDLQRSSAHSLTALFAFLVTPFILFTIGTAIYNAYFDPLSHIPGPKLWAAFPVFRWISGMRGTLDSDIRRYHNKYGKAVRFSVNEVSFNTSQGWTDIYSFKNTPQLPKPATRREPGRPPSIISANDADHSRIRKALAHGFSDRALREQEGLMQHYIDMLMSRLKDFALAKEPTNMVRYYNFTTFDIIGDLSFGKSFGCLETGGYHWFIENTIKLLQGSPYIRFALYYPLFTNLLKSFISKEFLKARDGLFEYGRDTVDARLNNESQKGRYDFIDALTKDDVVAYEEILGTSTTLIFAGSETTATLLSGVTYHLLRNPRVLNKVVSEVRSAFNDESEISLATVNSANTLVPYMNAVLEEALRLYPPVPSGLARMTTHDMPIDDVVVPKGVEVMVHMTATHWSESNFTRPKEFIPERWLPEAKEPDSEFYHDDRASVQPFSIGPRNCIGKNLANSEMRLILARVLWNFDLELCKESESWSDQRSYILWEKPPLMCQLKLSDKATVPLN